MLVATMLCKIIPRVFILSTLIFFTSSKSFLVETDDKDSPADPKVEEVEEVEDVEVEEDCLNKDKFLEAHRVMSNE